VGLLLHQHQQQQTQPKVFNWSEFHLSEVTSYKIHTLVARNKATLEIKRGLFLILLPYFSPSSDKLVVLDMPQEFENQVDK
jgi:hypothetical protein